MIVRVAEALADGGTNPQFWPSGQSQRAQARLYVQLIVFHCEQKRLVLLKLVYLMIKYLKAARL